MVSYCPPNTPNLLSLVAHVFHDLLPPHFPAWCLPWSPSHTTNQAWNPNASCEFPSFTQTLSSTYNILHEQI